MSLALEKVGLRIEMHLGADAESRPLFPACAADRPAR